MTKILSSLALLLCGFSTNGCVLAAAAAGGAIAADEISEDDGQFDPFEDAYDEDPDTEVITTNDKKKK